MRERESEREREREREKSKQCDEVPAGLKANAASLSFPLLPPRRNNTSIITQSSLEGREARKERAARDFQRRKEEKEKKRQSVGDDAAASTSKGAHDAFSRLRPSLSPGKQKQEQRNSRRAAKTKRRDILERGVRRKRKKRGRCVSDELKKKESMRRRRDIKKNVKPRPLLPLLLLARGMSESPAAAILLLPPLPCSFEFAPRKETQQQQIERKSKAAPLPLLWPLLSPRSSRPSLFFFPFSFYETRAHDSPPRQAPLSVLLHERRRRRLPC